MHLSNEHTSETIHGRAGLTFGRQIGAYPILIGVPYHIPLESSSNIMITGHGARSITGVEIGLDINTVTEKQLEAIPGLGKKSAWNLISARAKLRRKETTPSVEAVFEAAQINMESQMKTVLGSK